MDASREPELEEIFESRAPYRPGLALRISAHPAALGALAALVIGGLLACTRTSEEGAASTGEDAKAVATAAANQIETGATQAIAALKKAGNELVETAKEANAKGKYEVRWPEREFKQVSSTCYSCHETLARTPGRPAREHITSAHFRAAVSCEECHGGNPKADDHELSHDVAMGFVGKLDAAGMNKKCGECHQQEVKTFIASKHFPEHEGVRQVTCIACHGSHDIGAGSRSVDFTWGKNCAECHDLPNVPDLPAELTAMLDAKQSAHAKMRDLRIKNNNLPYSREVVELHRQVRQLTAEMIHATQATGIGEKATKAVAGEKALEAQIQKELGQ